MKKVDYNKIIREHPWILEHGRKFVISPDADGFFCALWLTKFLDWKLVGFYDADVFAIKKEYIQEDIVYIDVEIFDAMIKSMGNHCVLPRNFKELGIKEGFSNCINPNIIREVYFDKYDLTNPNGFRHKYPFGTSQFLLSIIAFTKRKKLRNLSRLLDNAEKAVASMYPDGMIDNAGPYPENWSDWFRYLRFDEKWNPFSRAIKMNKLEETEARTIFYRKRDSFARSKDRRWKGLSLVDKKTKQLIDIEFYENEYRIRRDARNSVEGVLKMVCQILEIEYRSELFDCWDSLEVTYYEKHKTGSADKYFKKMLHENPISFAYTDNNTLYYTKPCVNCKDSDFRSKVSTMTEIKNESKKEESCECKTFDCEDGPKRRRKENFKFSMIGLSAGDSVKFDPLEIDVTVSSDKKICYNGKHWTLTGFCREFMPDNMRNISGAYQGPKYFSYDGKVLNEIRLSIESQ